MDSDSSLESEERHNGVKKWENRANSDVSDDENFSRGAKSIDSPPESPPRGGGNLDSPPASPAQALPESPHSSYSGSGGGSSGSSTPPLRDSSPAGSSPKSPQDDRRAQPRTPPESPRSPEQEPDGPASPNDDRSSVSDGRSNISSSSSLGSGKSHKSKGDSPLHRNEKMEIKSHGEDLSDVSDIESLGSVSDREQEQESIQVDEDEEEKEKGGASGGMNLAEETEQLDFEAEEEKEEVETDKKESDKPADRKDKEKEDVDEDEEEGEVKELEDGEISDEDENRPEETEPRPVCRFFSRGQCTWGSSCSFRHVTPANGETPAVTIPTFPALRGHPRIFRPWFRRGIGLRFFSPRFVHPGVTDKGNYTMFDMVRPLVPMNSGPPPPPHMFGTPMDMYGPRPLERPMMMRREEPPGESAWERGLRQAKEMLRRSNKRKETDVDFEEKKMNLTLSGQEEYDKENDYYTRASSPIYPEEVYHDRYAAKEGEKRYRSVSDRFGDYPPPGYYPPGMMGTREQWYDDRPSRYHHSSGRHHPSYPARVGPRDGGSVPPEDYYDRKRQKYSSREVVVPRSEKAGWKDGSPSPRPRGSERDRSVSGRGDEWADPWMRSKSPSRKGAAPRTSRKKSYSSRSSYSSSSSSRSSSYSSYSRSRSRSRSRTRSSRRSRSSRSRSRSTFSRKIMSSFSKVAKDKSPFSRDRRGANTERSSHMNPPPPSPRMAFSSRRSPSPTPVNERMTSRNMSARLLAAAMRDRSSSRSRSGSSSSGSSGSSSDSSSDSGSSSSSSRGATPPPKATAKPAVNRKKIEIEKLAQDMKVKAMDALKLSGQKQQIKLTLKDRVQPPVVNRKRLNDSPLDDDESPNISKKKLAPSRREELLKQLKAVEDAIARKRSKI